MNTTALAKKLLLTVLGLGIAGSLVGVGTFASFTTTATNPSNTFATGTLVIKQTSGSLSPNPCYSTSDKSASGTPATSSVACGAFFTVSNLKPGDSNTASSITVRNDGSLPATMTLAVSCTDGNASGALHSGTGDLCSAFEIYVQAKDGSTNRQCVYGNGDADVTCSFGNTSKTPAAYGSAKSLKNQLGTTTTWAAGDELTFVFGVKLDTSAGNTFQGRAASISLTWTADQLAGSAS